MRIGAAYLEEGVEFPSPTARFRRSSAWLLWRIYGHVFYRPIQRLWNWFHHYDYDATNSVWVPRFKSSERVKDWLWGFGTGKALVDMPVRYRLKKLLQPCHDCPHCGFDSWLDDDLYINDNDRAKMFECVNSGSSGTPDGTSYWCEGWRACYRCGVIEWWGEST